MASTRCRPHLAACRSAWAPGRFSLLTSSQSASDSALCRQRQAGESVPCICAPERAVRTCLEQRRWLQWQHCLLELRQGSLQYKTCQQSGAAGCLYGTCTQRSLPC